MELIKYEIDSHWLKVAYRNSWATMYQTIPIESLFHWATKHDRLKMLVPIYDDGVVVDHDEVAISFEAYVHTLDSDELLMYLRDRC